MLRTERTFALIPALSELNEAYAAAQREVDGRWRDRAAWRKSAIMNIANVGWFSSDRTISEYARDIWGVM